MNALQQILLGIRFMGLKSILQTIQYSRYRDRIVKRFSPPRSLAPQAVSPRKLENIKPFNNGAYFSFNDNIRLEVAFLSAHTVRLTWGPGQLAPKYAVGGDETIAIQVTIDQVPQGWQLTAGGFKLVVHSSGHVDYFSGGQLIRQDTPPAYTRPAWEHEAPLSDEAVIYGLGERTRLNLRPGSYYLWNQDPSGSYGPGDDPLYLNIPLYYCQQHSGGYLVFYENTFEAYASFDSTARLHFTDGALRFYVCKGPLPYALEEYTRLTGRAPLPPRWSLGFHQCRWGYHSADEVRRVLAGFAEHELPLDAFHFDIDYMDGYRIFTVDNERFPEFDKLIAEMKQAGVEPVVILDPGVKVDENYGVYSSGMRRGHFVKLPDGKPVRALVWPGWVNFPDFTNPETRRWWGSYYKVFLEDGVSGFWHDMNEPAAFTAWGENTLPRIAVHNFEGREGSHQEAHNIYGLQMNAAAFNAIRAARPNQRPWMLTRSGWAGIQRYAWKWTGDTESTWAALKMTVSTVLGLGVSGVPFSGPDIGGFSGNPEAELYIRWFQMSALMAFFRNHTAIHTERGEPWQYGPEATQICREMLLLRKRLMPYLYTLTWEAALNGAPVARPLAWAAPDDPRYWQIDDAYLLGSQVLVAPVVEEGADRRSILLPEGGWYHYWDGSYHQGGQRVEVPAPLSQIPFFIKEGSVLPMLEDSVLSLHVFVPPADGVSQSVVYHDQGEGYGASRLDHLTLHRRAERLFLQRREEGTYPGPDQFRIVLHGAEPGATRVDEQPAEWGDDGLMVESFENLKILLQ